MKKLALVFFAINLIAVSTIFAQSNNSAVVKDYLKKEDKVMLLEYYAKKIESFVTKEGKPHVIFADIADYNKADKPIWKKYNSEAEFEKARDTNESYTIAYIWKKDGKNVLTSFTYSSPSGDWAEYYFHTYLNNGTLAKSVKELRTFVGDVIVTESKIYDHNGVVLKKTKTFVDLNTKKKIKESDANYQKMDVGTIYKNVSALPFLNVKKSSDVDGFIPNGWKLETRTDGDLNKDSMADVVLQLIEKQEGNQNPKRMLLVLLKQKNGKYKKSAVAKNLILCQGCGGVIGGGADVKIEKGILLVSQLSGSREATNILHRFRYESRAKRFRLIGEDRNDFDRLELTSERTSTNYLTGRQIITISKGGENDVKETVKKKRVSRKRIYLEDVSYGN